MSRTSHIGRIATVAAVACALLLPASSAVAKDPVATKSGALINYVTTGKLKVSKKILVAVVCSVNCNVNTTTTIKAKGYHQTFQLSGALQAGVVGGPFFKPNGSLLKVMKAQPGAFKIVSSITATDPTTGASDAIAHTFKLKR
jgi:hypothetical protein